MKYIIQYLQLFIAFCHKDIRILSQSARNLLINYTLIYPTALACGLGAIQLPALVGLSSHHATMVFLGNLLILIALLSYRQHIELLFDRTSTKIINTQILVAPIWLICLQKLLFSACVSFVLMASFFPISKAILGSYLETDTLNAYHLIGILAVGHLFFSSYTLCMASYLQHPWQITRFSRRVNTTLNTLGGLLVPRFVMARVSPMLGYLVLLNPFLYVSEGLRASFFADDKLLPFWTSITVLLSFSILLYISSVHFLKKRMDAL